TELASGFDNVISFLNKTHEESMSIFRSLDNEDINKKCETPGGAQITVWKWLRLMPEHEIHHRGQLYTYLSMLGVKTPPIYGLTSEQVIERSSNG
ncbi:MAG TPA: DinB family protein, partial [Cyclobacteriaceae bacterium]|nr:DinB family protein [Cyclobacteriaceae bacterium]